jgi:hypothetical protein
VAAGRLTARLRSNSTVVAGLLAALWGLSLVPLVGVATANARLVEAFATDEALQLNLLRGAAANHTFALTFGPYGHLVFNLILIVLRLVPGELTDPRIVQTGRALSVSFAAATLWLTFAFARRVFGTAAAWIAFAALTVNATMYTWAAVLKPDMAQLFFLMAALALTCRLAEEPCLRWLALASGAAGLAFASKYSGMFLLPIIGGVCLWRPIATGRVDARVSTLRWLTVAKAATLFAGSLLLDAAWIASHLTEDGRIDGVVNPQALTFLAVAARGGALAALVAAVTPWLWSALRARPRLVALLWAGLVACATFAAAFVAVSPYSLRKAAFVKGLFGEAAFAPPPMTSEWLSTWFFGIGAAVGWPVVPAALLTMAGLAWNAARHRVRPGAAESILTAWVILYALVLSAPVHEFYVHYALPLAPPLAMLAGRGVTAVAGWLEKRLARRRLVPAVSAVAAAAIIVLGSGGLLSARSQLRARDLTNDTVFVGRWLGCLVPASTRIAYDYFSYVPPAFRDATPTWGGTREWLSRIDPDVVIVNSVTAGPVRNDAVHAEYYRCLAEGSCGYGPVLERGPYAVYVRDSETRELRARAAALGPGCDALLTTLY